MTDWWAAFAAIGGFLLGLGAGWSLRIISEPCGNEEADR